MGLIKETVNHPTIDDVEITVDEHAKDETREPYDIVSLDISFNSISNPDELVELGKWLVEQGERIKKQYTSKGKLRKCRCSLTANVPSIAEGGTTAN